MNRRSRSARAALITTGLATGLTGPLLLAFSAVPAQAAAPSNDLYAGRVAVGAVPFTQSVDTTEATTDADDADLNANCGAPATDASVWYEFTPSADGDYLVGLSADYSAGAIVASGGPGAWQVEGCAPEAVGFSATAGTTYTILVFDDQEDGAGNGGHVDVTVDVAPPAPDISITVDPKAAFTRSGAIVLTGSVSCSAGAFASVEAQVTQVVGRLKINGYGYTEIDCGDGSTQRWSMEVAGDNGVFRGGKAATVSFGFACGAFDCGVSYVEQKVMVSGSKR